MQDDRPKFFLPPISPTSLSSPVCVSSASTASALNWARRVSPGFTSRRTTPSAQWPNCGGPRRCRGTHGKSASRRRCGCHARAMSSCCREVYARGKARTKSVVANGIALFLETSYDDPPPAASIGYSFVDTVSIRSRLGEVGMPAGLGLRVGVGQTGTIRRLGQDQAAGRF